MSAQQQPVKVTLQSQRAGDSAKHNDRTMYRNGYFNELAPQDGLTNYHWSQETMGIGSEAREREVYEALFSEKVVQINESKKRHYRKDVYDLENPRQREAALEEYRWKHPPRETIFQIGSMDNPIDREQAKEILLHQGKRLEEMDSEHFVLLSYDIHMDEGSPHMHARYLMLDERGEVNAEGGLRALGVEPPVSYDKWAKEQNEKRAQRAEKNGKQYKTVKPKSSTNNNRLMTFTKNMRESFEELVEEYGISINTHRTRKKHLTQRAEKSARARDEVERDLEWLIGDNQAATQVNQQQAEELRGLNKQLEEDWDELELGKKGWREKKDELTEAETDLWVVTNEVNTAKERIDRDIADKRKELEQVKKDGAEEEAQLKDQLVKARKAKKDKSTEYQALIQQEQSQTQAKQNDIDRFKAEISSGGRYVELSQEYRDAKDEANEVFDQVLQAKRKNKSSENRTYEYEGEELNEDWFKKKFDEAGVLTVNKKKDRKELFFNLSKAQAKLDLLAEAEKKLDQNPFSGTSPEQMREVKEAYNKQAQAKEAADQQKQEYFKTRQKKWVPPTQQNGDEEEEEKKKDGQLGE